MKAAYADPPYPGCAKRHYGPNAQEIDHRKLIDGLEDNFDCWTLSTASTTLRDILPLCPPEIRICAWVKPFAATPPNIMPFYAWEPIILKPAERKGKHKYFVRDWVMASPPIYHKKTKSNCHGQKPQEFCKWLFEIMELTPEDELTDMFPGSGVVTKCWNVFKSQRRIDV